MGFATRFLGGIALRYQTQTGQLTPLPAVIRTLTAAANVLDSDETILMDMTSGAYAATLIAAATVPGQRFIFKKIDASANAATISGATIDGAASVVLSSQYSAVELQSNGTVYFIVGKV